MSRMAGKVVFVSGLARGQGRAHALRMASEGADIIGLDICAQIEGVGYPLATEEDLQRTVADIEALDRRAVVAKGDVSTYEDVKAVVDRGLAELGRIDAVIANAGITCTVAPTWEISQNDWDRTLAVNLTGVWNTVRATVPALIEGGNGGSIVLVSSGMGVRAMPNLAPYTASKHGVIGLMRTLALELAPHMIRANAILPGNIDTDMIQNDVIRGLFLPDVATPTREQFAEAAAGVMAMPVPWLRPEEISNAALWLASDEAQFVTGVALPVDAGFTVK